MMLNIGSGNSTVGDVRLDIYDLPNVNKVANVEEGLPFEENTFDDILCDCVFEHIKDPHKFLKECYRVLKKGGKMNLLTDNAGYLIFHTLKKARHGDYVDGTGGDKGKDRHYALYTKEHLANHFMQADFEVNKIDYIMLGGVTGFRKVKRWSIQKLIWLFFGERVGYPRLDCVVIKPIK